MTTNTQTESGPFLTLLTDGRIYTAPSIAADYSTVEAQAEKVAEGTGGNWWLLAIPLATALAGEDLLAASKALLAMSGGAEGLSMSPPLDPREVREQAASAIAFAERRIE